MLYFLTKRIFDIFFSISILTLFSPILLLSSIIIFAQDGNSIIFKQQRVGKNGKIFNFYKLRSMSIETPNVQSTIENKIKIISF